MTGGRIIIDKESDMVPLRTDFEEELVLLESDLEEEEKSLPKNTKKKVVADSSLSAL